MTAGQSGAAGSAAIDGPSGLIVVDAIEPHIVLETVPDGITVDDSFGEIAAAEASAQRGYLTSPLAALDCVVATAGREEFAELCDARAWQALPATVALARAAAKISAIVDELSTTHRDQLTDRITSLVIALRAGGWNGEGAEDLDSLQLLLGQVPDRIPDEIIRSADSVFAGSKRVQVTAFGLSLSSDDLRPDLGDDAELLFAGATFVGSIPGIINVSAVLQAGTVDDLPPLVVQLATAGGELLADVEMTVQDESRLLPVATAVADLGNASSTGEPIHATITRRDGMRRDAEGWRRLAIRRGRTAGLAALRARDGGQPEPERREWRRSAEFHRFAGLDEVADRAAELEEQVTNDAESSWMYALLEKWSTEAGKLTAAALTGPRDLGQVFNVIRDLSLAAPTGAALIDANLALAAALIGAADEDDREDGISCAAAALRLSYRLGDEARARRVARLLSET